MLTVNNVSVKDGGQLTCTATSEAGTAEHTVSITVQRESGVGDLLTPLPPRATSEAGTAEHTVSITVQRESRDPPSIPPSHTPATSEAGTAEHTVSITVQRELRDAPRASGRAPRSHRPDVPILRMCI